MSLCGYKFPTCYLMNIKTYQVKGYNKFYLNFNRNLNSTSRDQLQFLYNQLGNVTLEKSEDLII
jgi:hypothetical protein